MLTKLTKGIRRGGLLVLSAMSLAGLSLADGPTITGFIDTTYNYNFDNPLNNTNALRSYDARDNNIAMNNAHLAFAGTMGDAGYNIEIDAGTDASVNRASDPSAAPGNFDIQEAYMTYKCPKTGFGLKIGKFVTFNGIEVVESKDNPTISRGFLYGLAEPVSHTGAFVNHGLFGDKLDLGVGVVNGWDQNTDVNDDKTLVGKVALNLGDPLSFVISGYHGSEQISDAATDNGATVIDESNDNDGNARSTIDFTGVTKIIPRLALWFQANYGQEEGVVPSAGGLGLGIWSGVGIQPVLTVTDKFSIGARVEYFDDADGARTGTPDNFVTNYTITPSFKMTDNLVMRLEYRQDQSNKDIFMDDKGDLQDTQSTVGIEYILTF